MYIIFSLGFCGAVGFVFYVLLKRKAFASLSVLGLYFLFHLFVFIIGVFSENVFWGVVMTGMSLLYWSWLFLVFFVPSLFFDFWRVKRVNIQNNKNKIKITVIILIFIVFVAGFIFVKYPEFFKGENNKNDSLDEIEDENIVQPLVGNLLKQDNWKTYKNNQYGFEFKYPLKLNNVGEEAPNSVLGSADNPVKGIYVGSLVFVVLDSNNLRNEGRDYFDRYYNYNNLNNATNEEESEEGGMTCSSEIVKNYLFTRFVKCHGGGGGGAYALIKGDEFDIFVDWYSGGFKGNNDFVNLNEEEVKEIISTFKFIEG